jgi:hypothetical protein
VTLREQMEEQNRAWRRFHEWESQQPLPERDAASIISDLGTILDWIPKEVRLEDPDPEKKGVQKMIAALRHVSYPER